MSVSEDDDNDKELDVANAPQALNLVVGISADNKNVGIILYDAADVPFAAAWTDAAEARSIAADLIKIADDLDAANAVKH